MRKFTSQEIKEFVSKPLFDEKVILNKDPSWPKISIVTPSYNQAEFLERTILSVLNQNYPNLEYIIIDGGSTDGSVEIIKKYEKYLSYWVSEKDRGQAHALNKGFTVASGKILAWINSDDIYLPNIFYTVAKFFAKNPHVSVLYGNKLIIDLNDNIVSERRVTKYIPYLSKLGFIYGGFGIYQPASFWTKSIYDISGGIDISFRFCMDNDLFYKFLLEGAKFKFIREYFTGFRIHPNSKTSTLKKIAEEEFSILIKKYNLKHNSLLANYIRFLVRIHRVLLYIFQGDIDYLFFKIFKDRLKWVP